MNENGFWGWLAAGVSTVIATLASAVAYLYRSGETKNANAIQQLRAEVEECREDRIELRVEIAHLEERVKRQSGALPELLPDEIDQLRARVPRTNGQESGSQEKRPRRG